MNSVAKGRVGKKENAEKDRGLQLNKKHFVANNGRNGTTRRGGLRVGEGRGGQDLLPDPQLDKHRIPYREKELGGCRGGIGGKTSSTPS